MGNDYDSFGDFFDDVAEQYDKMDDSGFDSDEPPSLGKFVSDLAEAASRANSEDTVEGSVERPGRTSSGELGGGSGGRELPDPPSIGDVDVGVSRGGESRSTGAGGVDEWDAEKLDAGSSASGDRDVVDDRPGISERNLEAMVENDYISRSEASTLKKHLGKKKHLTSEQIQRMGGEHGIISGNLKNRLLRALDGGKGHVMEVSAAGAGSSTGGGGGGSGLPFSIESVRRRGGPSQRDGIAWSDVAVLEKDGLIPGDVADQLLELFYSGQVEILQRDEIEELYNRGVISRDVQRVLLQNTGPRKIGSHEEYYGDLTESDLIPDTVQGSQSRQASQGSQSRGGGVGPDGVDVSEFGPEHIVELAEKGVFEEGEARTILERMGVSVSGGREQRGGRGSESRTDYDEGGSVSVDEMVERFQRELERNR